MFETAYDCVPVAGVRYRAMDALDFMEAIDNGLPGGVRLELEPTNIYDANAIKVIGWWASPDQEERHIGYVPAVLSELIAYKRMSMLVAELANYDLVEGTNEIVLEIRIGVEF